MATYIAQFNEYTHKVQTLKVSSNFKVATALATAGDYKRIYDLLSIMFDYKAIENLKLDKGVILPDAHHTRCAPLIARTCLTRLVHSKICQPEMTF